MLVRMFMLVFILTSLSSCRDGGGKKDKSDFLWGVAISGFQSDMGPNSPKDENSDWWVWTHDEYNIEAKYVKDVPENGPDFWTHYKKDLDIAVQIGVNAFRYGIEWSRIFPRSTTGVKVRVRYSQNSHYPIVELDGEALAELEKLADHDSIKKYKEMISYMRDMGLKVFITLNHFSLPLWIHDPIACRDWFSQKRMDDRISDDVCFGKPSGWLSSDSVVEFAKYCAFVARKFGDLIDMWGPINEPIVVAMSGYLLGAVSGHLGLGAFPPAASNKEAFERVLRNMIIAHAAAYDAIHLNDKEDSDGDGIPAQVSLIYNISYVSGDEDKAVQSAWDFLVWRYLDYVLLGKADSGVLDELKRKADIIGINYYNRIQVAYVPVIPSLGIFFIPLSCPQSEPSEVCPYGVSEMGYEIYPPGLYEVIKAVWERYKNTNVSILVAENGVADSQDRIREWFIREHLKHVKRALDEKIPVIGYFYWSLIDNLEWSLGFEKKFGLVEVDFSSVERTRKIRKSAFALVEEIKKW